MNSPWQLYLTRYRNVSNFLVRFVNYNVEQTVESIRDTVEDVLTPEVRENIIEFKNVAVAAYNDYVKANVDKQLSNISLAIKVEFSLVFCH